jgi:predicted NAD-dependent protein-ADP-ribosyltransferase YbiA (DUF1768 family)
MELYSNEVEKLKTQVANWLTHPQRELEATFGHTGTVDQMRFLAIAQRLKAKGYREENPKDYLTITIKEKGNLKNDVNIRRDTLKNNTRFTVEGSENVRAYCEQESLEGLPYTVMLKTPLGNPAEDDLFLEDYDVKIKVRREMERATDDAVVQSLLAEDAWSQHMKAFRLIRRWSFFGPNDAYRFDLSMVRSNKKNASGAYELTQTFRSEDQDILQNPVSFEIEVELLHEPFPLSPNSDKSEVLKSALNELVKSVGEVLRGLQNNTILIRKSQKKKALDAYFNLVRVQQFRGVKPRTLEMKNFIAKKIPNVPNIREGYNVTDKADGLRVLGFCDREGELFMIDKALNVYRTGMKNPLCKNSLVDGEWITSIKDEKDETVTKSTNQLWLFDIYIAPEEKVVDKLPFYVSGKQVPKETPTRYKELQEWAKEWRTNGPKAVGIRASNQLVVQVKNFLFAEKGLGIFAKAKEILGRKTEYHTDGLIFTINEKGLPGPDTNFPEQFKWKPSEENTIDFLIRIEKNKETGEEEISNELFNGKMVEYKTLILKVGSTMNEACANPRDTILNEKPYPKGGCRSSKFMKDTRGKYKAVPFNPTDYADPMASVCKIPLKLDLDTQVQYIATEKSNEPIRDYSIVEMRYDMSKPPGWRWIPVRVRVDKTEKLQRGELTGTLNADFTADSIWNSIHNPITRSMISTGNEAPDKSEIEGGDELVDLTKPYFQRKANKQELQSVEGMRNFHKHYIKGDMLLTPTLKGGDKYVLDLAVGEAADINRWITNKVGFVYGIDIAAAGITDAHRGAYTKYLNRLSENAGLPEEQQIPIAPMVFGIGNASKSLATGEAGVNEEESNILRSIFGKVAPTPQPPVPSFVKIQGANKLQQGADVIACMFALHYFFKDKATFQGLLSNIQQNLRVGGYFVACFFDGEKVFELLKTRNEGESVSGQYKNAKLWQITKEYSNTTLPTDDSGFGLPILNNFISIGSEHREYLVPFDLLKSKMEEIGCRLLTSEDLATVGLTASTETFDMSYKRATEEAKKKGKELFPMIPPVQQYSFLNRWCIFRRYGEEEAEVEESVVPAVPAKTAKKAPQSLAWADVSQATTGLPGPVLPAATITAGTAPLDKSKPISGKPIGSLGTVMATAAAEAAPKGLTMLAQQGEREFSPEKVFYFGVHEKNTEVLKDKDNKVVFPEAARLLGPGFPFPVLDEQDPKHIIQYPSLLHYVAAMEYKLATNQPGLGESLFSNTGTIHLKYIQQGELKKSSASKAQLPILEQELQAEEAKEVLSSSPVKMFKKYNLQYDEPKWIALRDGVWKGAYEQRYGKDKRFREILGKLRELEKYLVYRATADNKLTTNLGGVGRKKGKMTKLEGENKLGVLLMTIAGYPEFKIETMAASKEE